MSVDTAVTYFRRRQQELFRDEATVSRPTPNDAGVINTSSNVWTPTAATVIYTGPCLLRAFTWQGTSDESADQYVRVRGLVAKFPVDTDIRRDDTIVASVSTYDVSLIGIGFRVTDAFRDGWQIVRKIICEEITE